MEKLAFSVSETAKILGLGYVKTYEEIRTGRLRTFRVGRRRLCSAEALRDYIERCEAEERANRGAPKRLGA